MENGKLHMNIGIQQISLLGYIMKVQLPKQLLVMTDGGVRHYVNTGDFSHALIVLIQVNYTKAFVLLFFKFAYQTGILQPHKWENAMTIDKFSWGHRNNAKLDDFLTSKELIKGYHFNNFH